MLALKWTEICSDLQVHRLDLKCPNYPNFGGKDSKKNKKLRERERERERRFRVVDYLLRWPNTPSMLRGWSTIP
jgi:hypothetical protein